VHLSEALAKKCRNAPRQAAFSRLSSDQLIPGRKRYGGITYWSQGLNQGGHNARTQAM